MVVPRLEAVNHKVDTAMLEISVPMDTGFTEALRIAMLQFAYNLRIDPREYDITQLSQGTGHRKDTGEFAQFHVYKFVRRETTTE